VSVVNAPDQVIALTPPGNPPAGTGKASPERNALAERLLGTFVDHRLLAASKLVVAAVEAGSNVIVAPGTGRL
jgi:hypothetical protein